MLVLTDPARAYRKVDRDAAIMGSDSRALTLLCYDEFLGAIRAALHADTHQLINRRRDALSKANAALSAIRGGMDHAHPMAAALSSMFDAAESSLRGAMVRFRPESLLALRDDFSDIRGALASAA